MRRATSFALRRSKLVIGAWFVAVGTCALLGLASGDSFTPTIIKPPGTDTERWGSYVRLEKIEPQ